MEKLMSGLKAVFAAEKVRAAVNFTACKTKDIADWLEKVDNELEV